MFFHLIVALTRDGDVYTFGMNNKGQCGRDFTAPRDPAAAIGIIPSSNMMATNATDVTDDINR